MLHHWLLLLCVSNSALAFVRREADASLAACAGQLCKNGGTLQVSNTDFSCSCPSGYTGYRCEQGVCDVLCKNGGILKISDARFSCSCPTGYTGNRCESLSCQNGATMVKNADGSISCTCPANYYGTYCEKSCPNGFTLLPKTGNPVGCYNFVNTVKTFPDAQKNCNSLGATSALLVVDSADEQSALKSYLSNTPVPAACVASQYWTAGQRIKEADCASNFVWKPFPDKAYALNYTSWISGQPDCYKNAEGCLALWGAVNNWTWNDFTCSSTICSVCEVPL